MKFLFILLLFTISCTDKEDFAHTIPKTSEPIVEEEIVLEPIVASYDNSSDLILIGSDSNP